MSKITKILKNDSGALNPGLLIVALALIGLVYLMTTAAYTPNCPDGQTWNGSQCVSSVTPTPTPTPVVTPISTPIATPIPTPTTTYIPLPTIGNLIKNPTFDTNTYSWNLFTNGSSTFKSLNGKGVVSIAAKGTNTQVYQYNLALKANTKYRLTFDAHSNTGHDMHVRVIKHVYPFTQYVSFFPALGTTPSTFTKEFTTSSAESNARLMFWVSNLGYPGDVYTIDNVKLVAVQ